MTVLFGTHFATPAQLAALASSWSATTSWLTLTWTPYAGDASLFWRYRVYRSLDLGVTWTQIDEDALADPTVGAFVDYDAPLQVALQYRVTMDNGVYEGPIATVADNINLVGWWIVTPGDATLSFRLTHQQAPAARNPEQVQTVRYPMGRSTALITAGPRRKASGSVPFKIPIGAYAQVEQLRDAAQASIDNGYGVLKTGTKEAFRARFSSPSVSVGQGAISTGDFDWWQVQ